MTYTMSNSSQLALDCALSHQRCAIDIGGTLTKLVYLQPIEQSYTQVNKLLPNQHDLYSKPLDTDYTDDSYHLYSEYGKNCFTKTDENQANLAKLSIQVSSTENLCFEYFHSQDIRSLVNFILKHKLLTHGSSLNVTGGGAYKFADLLSDMLKVNLNKRDEMNSIMKGLNFALTLPNSVFRYDVNLKSRIPVSLEKPIYPLLVVNIGSGVSILKANSDSDFSRVTGTCVGGGTVLGLAKLIFGAKSFHEVATLSEQGVDILDITVGDLIGDHSINHSLPLHTFASSFGRNFLQQDSPQKKGLNDINKSDIARSLIRMVSYNIGYLAYLVGSLHNVHRVYFAGKYIDNHSFTMESITYGVNFYDSAYSNSLLYSSNLTNTKDNTIDIDYNSNTLNTETNYSNFYNMVSINNTNSTSEKNKQFEVFFLKHDGYLGALGSFLS